MVMIDYDIQFKFNIVEQCAGIFKIIFKLIKKTEISFES